PGGTDYAVGGDGDVVRRGAGHEHPTDFGADPAAVVLPLGLPGHAQVFAHGVVQAAVAGGDDHAEGVGLRPVPLVVAPGVDRAAVIVGGGGGRADVHAAGHAAGAGRGADHARTRRAGG